MKEERGSLSLHISTYIWDCPNFDESCNCETRLCGRFNQCVVNLAIPQLYSKYEAQRECIKVNVIRSETTLNYWMMMERNLNLKEEVGRSIPDCEISLLNEKLSRWSTTSCAMALACRQSVSKKVWCGSPNWDWISTICIAAFTPAQTIRAGGLLLEEPNQALSSLSFGYNLVKSKAWNSQKSFNGVPSLS